MKTFFFLQPEHKKNVYTNPYVSTCNVRCFALFLCCGWPCLLLLRVFQFNFSFVRFASFFKAIDQIKSKAIHRHLYSFSMLMVRRAALVFFFFILHISLITRLLFTLFATFISHIVLRHLICANSIRLESSMYPDYSFFFGIRMNVPSTSLVQTLYDFFLWKHWKKKDGNRNHLYLHEH